MRAKNTISGRGYGWRAGAGKYEPIARLEVGMEIYLTGGRRSVMGGAISLLGKAQGMKFRLRQAEHGVYIKRVS